MRIKEIPAFFGTIFAANFSIKIDILEPFLKDLGRKMSIETSLQNLCKNDMMGNTGNV